jgi:hypothetical protein
MKFVKLENFKFLFIKFMGRVVVGGSTNGSTTFLKEKKKEQEIFPLLIQI